MTIEKLSDQLIEFYDKIASWEHSVVKGSELTPAQMHTIELIGYHKNLRMKELAERLGITTGTLTVAVDKLEKLGLVTRQPHRSDRRSFCIVLTEKGTAMFEEHHRFHREFTDDITEDLAEEEIRQLSSYFETILKKM